MTPVFLDHPQSSSCLLVMGKEHADLIHSLQNDPETRQYLTRYIPETHAEVIEWIEKHDSNNIVLTVATKPDKTPIGTMGLHRIDWRNRRATTGAVLSLASCNKGYGSHAKMLLLAHAFLTLGLNKVESRAHATNERSIAYSKKCGYEEVARLRRHTFQNGEWIDEVILEVHASTWKPLWKQFEQGEFNKKPTPEPFPGHYDACSLGWDVWQDGCGR